MTTMSEKTPDSNIKMTIFIIIVTAVKQMI